MSDYTVIEHCSPTLAGIKTGNLFSCPFTSLDEIRREIRRLNRRLLAKGLRALPLSYKNGRVLVYVYRPENLKRDLKNPEALRILRECGYSTFTETGCVCALARRFRDADEFPHEIGLFLSYPPEDVSGFIRHHGKDYRYSGFWKVYGDVEASQKKFAAYKACTNDYVQRVRSGAELEQLVV